MKADPELNEGIILKVLYASGLLMGLFNLGIAADVLPKCVRYIKRAMDGVTPIDTKEISSSRDSMISRRRSSIMKVVDVVSPTKRYSLTTGMNMNAVEDIVNTKKNEEDDDIDLELVVSNFTAKSLPLWVTLRLILMFLEALHNLGPLNCPVFLWIHEECPSD